jgi:F-type H+-transporting ATPase subunit b
MFSSEYTWLTASLVIFLGLVMWKGLKPMLASLDARGERIRREIEEAQNLREDAQNLLAEYKRKQRDALKEAEEIVSHAKAEAEILRSAAEKELQEQLQRREIMAVEKIKQAEAQAVAEVRSQAVEVAAAAAAKLIAENINEAKASDLTMQAIKDVSTRLN